MLDRRPRPQRIVWFGVAYGSAMIAGMAMRRSLKTGWRRVRKEEPPLQPASPRTGWIDAMLWAELTGMLVGLARLVARRGAAAGWRRATGSWPDGL